MGRSALVNDGRGGDHRLMRARRFAAAFVVVGVALSACGSSTRGTKTVPSSTPRTSLPGSPSATATTTSPTTPPASPPTTAAPRTRNLLLTPEVRSELERTYAEYVATHIPFTVDDIAGEWAGRTYYGYDGPSVTYWAVAYFLPSQAAIDRGRQLPLTSSLNPLIYFQDGPYLFSQVAGSSWRFVGDSYPDLCSPPIPKALLDLWGLAPVPPRSVTPPLDKYCVYYFGG